MNHEMTATKLIPENLSLHLKLADFFLRMNNFDRAKIQYAKILKIDPANSDAKTGLAKCINNLSD